MKNQKLRLWLLSFCCVIIGCCLLFLPAQNIDWLINFVGIIFIVEGFIYQSELRKLL